MAESYILLIITPPTNGSNTFNGAEAYIEIDMIALKHSVVDFDTNSKRGVLITLV